MSYDEENVSFAAASDRVVTQFGVTEAAETSRALISRAEALLLLDTVEMLHAIEGRAAKASWGTPTEAGSDEPTAYALGRNAEACDRAAHEIENALITLSVWGKAEAAAKALTTDDDDEPRDETPVSDCDCGADTRIDADGLARNVSDGELHTCGVNGLANNPKGGRND